MIHAYMIHNASNPPMQDGSYLALCPTEFPKNSKWMVAEYYTDNNTWYSEADEYELKNVTHWVELPEYP